jgi:hypothetical protein
MGKEEKLDQLAAAMARLAEKKLGKKARLRVVGVKNLRDEVPSAPEPGYLDGPTRDAYFSQIRDRARMYWLQWIVRQECHHHGRTLEELDDDQLIVLARKMEQAWQCRVEGIAFDEVPGLVREGTVAL